MIDSKDWKWFGTSGHFICGQWCRFHLCTLVGDTLVSTVGEYVHPRHGAGSEQTEAMWLLENGPGEDIGPNRKYETMTFKAGAPCDADGCKCGIPRHSGTDLDFDGYNDAGSATEGHHVMCMRVAERQEPDTQKEKHDK